MGEASDDVPAGDEEGKPVSGTDNEDGSSSAETKKKLPEPSSFELKNPSRITPEQEQCVSFNLEQRYVPINPRSKPAGIIVLADRTPDEPEVVLQVLPSVIRFSFSL